jgi:alpha-beta hydrolase superfamily lysophospholipase
VSERQVTFESGGLTLAGTWAEAPAPTAAALLLVGLGSRDRDSNTSRYRPGVTAAIADALRDAGVSAMRYDKRGVGSSEGDFLRAGMGDNLADARSALVWLAARADGLPLFAVGHGEGALHAAQLAADGRVAGAVLVALPAQRGEEALVWELQTMLPTLRPPARAIASMLGLNTRAVRRRFAKIRASSADVMRLGVNRVNARWYREYLDHDPATVLAQVAVPILALSGGHDVQVPPQDTQTVCRLVRGPCSAVIVDGVSHILRADPDLRGLRGYSRAMREPVDPAVLGAITDWIGRAASAAPPPAGGAATAPK